MPPILRTRDQKRVLHNRTAVEKGLHLFPLFKSMDEWTVKCLRCERDIDLWTWSGQKKIFNLTARLELKCGGDEFQGEEHSAVSRREANRNNWGVQPRRHIFLLCNPSNVGEVRCRRPQCWLYREPRNMTTWPTLQLAECWQTRTKINTKFEHQVKSRLWRQRREELCLTKCAAIRREIGYSCKVYRNASPITRSSRAARGIRLLRVGVTESLIIKVAGEGCTATPMFSMIRSTCEI